MKKESLQPVFSFLLSTLLLALLFVAGKSLPGFESREAPREGEVAEEESLLPSPFPTAILPEPSEDDADERSDNGRAPATPVESKAVEVSAEPAQQATQDESETTVQVPEALQASFEEINENARNSLVNVLCTFRAGTVGKTITGSGVIISPKGVILTNAHVAQYFLLREIYPPERISCAIRTGSPARPAYTADPLYISEAWVHKNSAVITQEDALGTGESDYALLFITGASGGKQLRAEFTAIDLSFEEGTLGTGEHLLIAGYPAGFFGAETVVKNLYISSTVTDIKDRFTFGSGLLDLVSFGGNILAQKGISGGAVVGGEGDLAGIVVTSTSGETTQERNLAAITLSYISRSLEGETGTDLPTALFADPKSQVAHFGQTTAPELAEILRAELEK